MNKDELSENVYVPDMIQADSHLTNVYLAGATMMMYTLGTRMERLAQAGEMNEATVLRELELLLKQVDDATPSK